MLTLYYYLAVTLGNMFRASQVGGNAGDTSFVVLPTLAHVMSSTTCSTSRSSAAAPVLLHVRLQVLLMTSDTSMVKFRKTRPHTQEWGLGQGVIPDCYTADPTSGYLQADK
jgi:hypothetical protein